MMRVDPLETLEAALEEQGARIIAGAFDGLAEIEARLTGALAALAAHPLDRAQVGRLDRIKSRAARQGQLLQAALRGVQDARAARQGGRGFTSYDSLGRADRIGGTRPRFERRS